MSHHNGNGNGKAVPAHHVFLGMPGYGEQTAGAARGFWRASKLPDSRVIRMYHEGSLLAANFNSLWVNALNLVHGGQSIDYFAMQHADIEPADWWLDTLIAEMEAKGLDMLGVVVPIKDHKGLTSIALDRPDGDTWRPLCRLTLSEIYRLPETFTSEDVGHPILLNTGLWVCRFDEFWAKKVQFTINDRIVFDRGSDKYLAQCEPEDWYFSRLCHELDLKIGATRKVPVQHRGSMQFPSGHPWGQPFDSAWTDKSVVPDPMDASGFALPADIEGWLRPEEGFALAELARGKRVLEIGSYCGLSTICMARTAAHVVAVDPFDGRATPEPGDTLGRFRANLLRYGVADKVEIIVGTMTDAYDQALVYNQTFGPFDLIFIDGAHDYESVASDIANAIPLLTEDGLLAFHDYRTFPGQYDGRWDEGVTQAVDELVARGGELISTHATLAVVKPPAPIPLSLEV